MVEFKVSVILIHPVLVFSRQIINLLILDKQVAAQAAAKSKNIFILIDSAIISPSNNMSQKCLQIYILSTTKKTTEILHQT